MPGSAAVAPRSTMREKPGADSSARVPRQKRMVIAHFPAGGGVARVFSRPLRMGSRGAIFDPMDVQGRGLYFEVQGVPDFELAYSTGRIAAECTGDLPRVKREHR